MKTFNPDLNNQDASPKLNILGYLKNIRHIGINTKTLYYLFNTCIIHTPFESGYIMQYFRLILRITDDDFRINRKLNIIKA